MLVLLVAIATVHLASTLWHLVKELLDIILLFFLAWLLAFTLEPFVDLLTRGGRLPRPLAVTAVFSLLLLTIAATLLLVIPALTAQIVEIAEDLPSLAQTSIAWLAQMQAELAARGIAIQTPGALDVEQISRRIESLGPAAVTNALSVATGLATFFVNVVVVLILAFYITLDGHRLGERLVELAPASRRRDVAFFLSAVRLTFGGFIRGQMLQALVYAVGTGLIMTAFNLQFALSASIFGGITMVIPFIGSVIALVPPLLIVLLVQPQSFWWVLGLLLALQALVVYVIAPKLMSRAVGMHPLLVFFALLVGAKAAGLWGALFAIPIVAVVVTMISFYWLARSGDAATSTESIPGPPPVTTTAPALPVPPHTEQPTTASKGRR